MKVKALITEHDIKAGTVYDVRQARHILDGDIFAVDIRDDAGWPWILLNEPDQAPEFEIVEGE